ncbi:MAG: hypothetical protein MI919_09630, partial [Holophagales bacterium]|nr:hypothetical protein [Holophagales bacterium]
AMIERAGLFGKDRDRAGAVRAPSMKESRARVALEGRESLERRLTRKPGRENPGKGLPAEVTVTGDPSRRRSASSSYFIETWMT